MIDNISEYCVHNKHFTLVVVQLLPSSSLLWFYIFIVIFVVRYFILHIYCWRWIYWFIVCVEELLFFCIAFIIILQKQFHFQLTLPVSSLGLSIWKCGAAFEEIVLLCGKLLLTPISDLYIIFRLMFRAFALLDLHEWISYRFDSLCQKPSRIIIIIKNFILQILIKSKYHHHESRIYVFIQFCGWKRKILWTLNTEHTIDISGYHSIIKNLFISIWQRKKGGFCAQCRNMQFLLLIKLNLNGTIVEWIKWFLLFCVSHTSYLIPHTLKCVYFSTLFHCKNNLNAFKDNEIYYKRRFHCYLTKFQVLFCDRKEFFDFINDTKWCYFSHSFPYRNPNNLHWEPFDTM